MEALLTKLRACSRLLELEDSIPYWESQLPELKARIEEMDWNRRQKEAELSGLESPNFFRKLFGKTEEKKEKLSRQIREIAAARMAVQWELEGLEKRLAAGNRELEDLAGSREAYEAAKAETLLTPALESRLIMEEISAFAPAAMETAGRILESLEDARPWMQRDSLTTRVGQDNRKMEHLSNAEAAAVRLRGILSVLPEGIATVGSYLQAPHDYIYGVTSEFKQLDRLNQAQEQIRTIRNQIRLVLGE